MEEREYMSLQILLFRLLAFLAKGMHLDKPRDK